MAQARRKTDVAIIGAGPAGSAAAAVLAEKGRRVTLVERETFPRYRVGESLVPYCWYPLDRLGLVSRVRESSFVVPKHSVQFVSVDGEQSTPFYFLDHTDHESATTWQVVRSEFDALLLDNALDKGAELVQPATVRDFLRDGRRFTGLRVDSKDEGEFDLEAKVTLDASGRDAFAQLKNGWRVPDRKLCKMAIWTYYRGAKRQTGRDEGATTIAYLPYKGWFWYIPLPEDTVSVGVVADRDELFRETRDPKTIFHREVEAQRWIAERLEPGVQEGGYRVTSDFSYRSRHCAADGLVLLGDAFAFLDPVFSSGVYLALQGGVMAADAAQSALGAGDVSAGRFVEYGERFLTGVESMRRLVHAFYDHAFSFGDFLKAHPDKHFDLTDCLVGNLFRDFDPFFEAVGEFAEIPEPLAHGLPLVDENG
jgi:flavin-dependent dehydrogenase